MCRFSIRRGPWWTFMRTDEDIRLLWYSIATPIGELTVVRSSWSCREYGLVGHEWGVGIHQT